MNSSGDLQWTGMHCSKDALTDVFGWFLQGLLAGMAFTCLIGKYGAIAVAYLVLDKTNCLPRTTSYQSTTTSASVTLLSAAATSD